MVLLVEVLAAIGGHHELVDALPEFRVGIWGEAGADAAIARLPGEAAVACLERADRGDTDPQPGRVGAVRDDRMEDETTVSRVPLRARRMVGEPGHVLPGRPTVHAPEEARRLDARIDGAMRGCHVPDGGELGTIVIVGEAFARMRPGRARVIAAPDRRSVPRARAAGEDCAALRVHRDIVDGPTLTQRTAELPIATACVAIENERALRRPDEQCGSCGHATLRSDSGRRNLPAPREVTEPGHRRAVEADCRRHVMCGRLRVSIPVRVDANAAGET